MQELLHFLFGSVSTFVSIPSAAVACVRHVTGVQRLQRLKVVVL